MFANMIMEDIAWLDLRRIHGTDLAVTAHPDHLDPGLDSSAVKRKRDIQDDAGRETGHREINPVT
jgi:hypothetical protein